MFGNEGVAGDSGVRLPEHIDACLFDLDGVLTDTAAVHCAAWKQAFNAFLHDVAEPTSPFSQDEYRRFVDGRSREDGVRDFLWSRGIELPEGESADPPDLRTVHGLANQKNQILVRLLSCEGVTVFAGSLRFLVAAKSQGIRRAVV